MNVLRLWVLPLILTFAGLLAGNPAAARQARAQENPRVTTTAGQGTKRGVERTLATIIQSGSTNSLGYTLAIHDDGSATAEIDNEPSRTKQFPAGTVDSKTLRRLLTEIGDVSKIPTGNCPKSVSFGIRTQITYAGKTSGDLQCIRPQEGNKVPLQPSEQLGGFVQTTLGQLSINYRRIGQGR